MFGSGALGEFLDGVTLIKSEFWHHMPLLLHVAFKIEA
jgi:hypothetical protein